MTSRKRVWEVLPTFKFAFSDFFKLMYYFPLEEKKSYKFEILLAKQVN